MIVFTTSKLYCFFLRGEGVDSAFPMISENRSYYTIYIKPRSCQYSSIFFSSGCTGHTVTNGCCKSFRINVKLCCVRMEGDRKFILFYQIERGFYSKRICLVDSYSYTSCKIHSIFINHLKGRR
jgi:hypothetical protein